MRPSPSRSSRPAAPAAQASAAARSAGSPSARARIRAKAATLALALVAPIVLSGCYLAHLAQGQLRLLRSARPIEEALADPATPPDVRDALAEVAPVLAYARALGLDVGRQYRAYAAWPGDRVVTALVATRPGEVRAAGFWFPIVGRVPYKGFFDPARAAAAAARLEARGLDTCLVAVPAYSTLGWFPDPVVTPLLRRGRGVLVETLLHELVHATVYVNGDADWNEGIATFVGQEGAVRYLAAHDGEEAASAERRRIADERAVARVLRTLHERVEAIYREPPSPARDAARAAASADARAALGALALTTLEPGAVAAAARLDDACLALAATYEADLDAYARRLAAEGGDLHALLAAIRAATRTDDPRGALGLPPRRTPEPAAR